MALKKPRRSNEIILSRQKMKATIFQSTTPISPAMQKLMMARMNSLM